MRAYSWSWRKGACIACSAGAREETCQRRSLARQATLAPARPGSYRRLKSQRNWQVNRSKGLLARREAKTQHASRPARRCLPVSLGFPATPPVPAGRQAGPSPALSRARRCRAARAAACSASGSGSCSRPPVACASLIPSG